MEYQFFIPSHWYDSASPGKRSTVKGVIKPRSAALDCLVGRVIKAPDAGAKDPGFESHLQQGFSGMSHTSDLKIGTPEATLPGTWHYRVIAWTGRPSVSIL